MKLVILISLALLSTIGLCKFSISKFMGPPFSVKPPSGFYDLGGLGFEESVLGLQVLAYGDFNNDKFTDIITLEDNLKNINVFYYSHGNFTFVPAVSLALGKTVASVIPADYNYDGRLDLLVITTSSTGDQTTFDYFFNQNTDKAFNPVPDLSSTVPGIVQPFIIDVDGDRHADLLFMNEGVRTLQTVKDGKIVKEPFDRYVSTATGCKPFSTVANHAFSVPHSNAFVDFNGDCAADLFITSVDQDNKLNFEIWLRNFNDNKFCLVDMTPINLPAISVVSIGDMNNDGRMDLVYASMPENPAEPMNLHIIYNKFSYDAKYPCKLQNTDMISPFANGVYNALETSPDAKVVPMIGTFTSSSRLFSSDKINRPSKIRLGDINIDGFPDLLFVVHEPTDNSLHGTVVLAMNHHDHILFTPNDEDTPYYKLLDSETFTSSGDKYIGTVSATSASFFDFDEYGRLGMWIVTYDSTSPSTNLIGAFNFVNSENFILKTLGLNGIAPTEDDQVTQTIGGLYYGASVECTVTDINGGSSLAKGSQLPQSAYTPLDLPYVFIGLGRTNNYIENFVMGISTTNGQDKDLQQQTWTPIIPNSQLIVNPLIQKDWTLDVFVNPTSETVLVILTTAIILILLGCIIVYQHLKEKEEDEKNRTHIVNF